MTIYIRIYADAADARSATGNQTSYATARNLTTATTTTDISALIGQNFISPNYTVWQYFGIFDTSAVAAGAGAAIFSVVNTSTPPAVGDTIELRQVSSATNMIAGDSLSAQTPLLGSLVMQAFANLQRVNVPIADITSMTRSSSCIILAHGQKQRLGTAPTADEGLNIGTSNQTGTTKDPFLEIIPATAWSFVGVSSVVETQTTALTLTEPAGVASGDLLVACIANRQGATTATTLPSGWAVVDSVYQNSTASTGSALASGTMAYIVRGSSAPALTFTLGAANVGLGRIVAYRGGATTSPLDASLNSPQPTSTLAVNTNATGSVLVTTQDDDLIVVLMAGGQEAAWSAVASVNAPSTASGATDTTTAPSTTAWIERADSFTTNGADTSLGIFDAVKTATGSTSYLSATASVAAGHVVIAGAFKIASAAGPVNVTVTPTGVSATGAVGSVTAFAPVNVGVTGIEATGAVGAVCVPQEGVWDTATWDCDTWSVPTAVTISATGVEATGSVGTVTVTAVARTDVTVPVTGVEATGAVGTVTATGRINITVPITGVEATGAVGSATVRNNVTVGVTGVAATGAVGTATATGITNVSTTVTGVTATGAVGTATATARQNISLAVTGVAATGAVGTVTATAGTGVSIPVTGVEATGAVGTATASGKQTVVVQPTGVSATGAVGGVSVAVGGAISVPVTGVQATGAVGTVGITARQNITTGVTGVAATGVVGTATASGKTNITIPVIGVAATGFVGNATVTAGGSISALVTGVQAAGSVGSVIVTVGAAGGLIKVWTGTAWADKPAKVWTGGAWAVKPVKHWTGSAWV